MSRFLVSCVRAMTAKNHFNEIKKTTTAGINNHVETISKVVKSYKICNTL